MEIKTFHSVQYSFYNILIQEKKKNQQLVHFLYKKIQYDYVFSNICLLPYSSLTKAFQTTCIK